MNSTINTAIETLAAKGRDAEKSDDALKFTQAALNLAHVLATIDHLKRPDR